MLGNALKESIPGNVSLYQIFDSSGHAMLDSLGSDLLSTDPNKFVSSLGSLLLDSRGSACYDTSGGDLLTIDATQLFDASGLVLFDKTGWALVSN